MMSRAAACGAPNLRTGRPPFAVLCWAGVGGRAAGLGLLRSRTGLPHASRSSLRRGRRRGGSANRSGVQVGHGRRRWRHACPRRWGRGGGRSPPQAPVASAWEVAALRAALSASPPCRRASHAHSVADRAMLTIGACASARARACRRALLLCVSLCDSRFADGMQRVSVRLRPWHFRLRKVVIPASSDEHN